MTHIRRKAFTLIELLVVIAIIALLAAILFPVFASARDKARAASCSSNMKQIGIGVQMYLQDNDERLFFRSGTSATSSRVGATTSAPTQSWWNQLLPYVKNAAIFQCPSDGNPTLSADDTGATTIPRSYVASAAIESLNAAQIGNSSQEIVITEKWGLDAGGAVNKESWLEAFDGDMSPDVRNPEVYQMAKFASRHQGGMECAFFDGHAKWVRPEVIKSDPTLNGCLLVHAYPIYPGKMCEEISPEALAHTPACTQGTGVDPNAQYDSVGGIKPNLCNNTAFLTAYATQSP